MGTAHIPDQIGDLPRIGRPANGALLEAGITTLEQVGAAGRRKLLAMHGSGRRRCASWPRRSPSAASTLGTEGAGDAQPG
jgi:hypothetical protein